MSYIDLDGVPVQNPSLIAAIKAVREKHTPDTDRALGSALNNATFLIPIKRIGEDGPTPNQVQYQAGRNVELFRLTGGNNQVFLPLCTDLTELALFSKEPISGMVVPAQMAFRITVEGFAGCVINPETLKFQIPKQLLQGQPNR